MIKISAPVGKRLPLDAGCFGKLYLASLDTATLEELLAQRPQRAYSPRTIADPQQIRDQLAQVRVQRYAIDDQEYLEDVWAVAAPVYQNRRLTAAVAVIGIARRMNLQARAKTVAGVCAAATTIEQRI